MKNKNPWYTKCTAEALQTKRWFHVASTVLCAVVCALCVAFLCSLKGYGLGVSHPTRGISNRANQTIVHGVERYLLLDYDGELVYFSTRDVSAFTDKKQFHYYYHVYKVNAESKERTLVESFKDTGFEKEYDREEGYYYKVEEETVMPKLVIPWIWIAVPSLLILSCAGLAFVHICSLVTKTKYENGEID